MVKCHACDGKGYFDQNEICLYCEGSGIQEMREERTMENKGLYVKYEVRKKENGELVDGCFVLRPDKDPAAVYALVEYVRYTENLELKRDVANWLKAVKGKEDVHYYEVGEGEYVIARSKEHALECMKNITDQVEKDMAEAFGEGASYEEFLDEYVRQLDDLDNFDDGIVLKAILEADQIPAYTHSAHTF
jgi:hypothetical protein